jgi:hypothetical protein
VVVVIVNVISLEGSGVVAVVAGNGLESSAVVVSVMVGLESSAAVLPGPKKSWPS